MKKALPEYITSSGNRFKKRHYDTYEKSKLIRYMDTCGELYAVAGYVYDCVSKKWTKLENGGFRDDQYEWSTQETYHIKKYDAAVSDEFLQHVLEKMAG